jgi:hypothetical protein
MAVLDVCRALNQNPSFQPAMRVIESITNSNPVQITTIYDHQYSDGLIVRIDVPNADGMTQINQLTGSIIVTGDNTFTIPSIDSTYFDAFVIPEDPLFAGLPPPGAQVCAFAVPVGESNNQLGQATRNVLPL